MVKQELVRIGRGKYVQRSTYDRMAREGTLPGKEKPKPTPAPTPAPPPKEEPKKPGLLESISPTRRIISAITGRRDGEQLTALERVQEVTGAVRNIAIGAIGVGAMMSAISAYSTSAGIIQSGKISSSIYLTQTSATRVAAIRAAATRVAAIRAAATGVQVAANAATQRVAGQVIATSMAGTTVKAGGLALAVLSPYLLGYFIKEESLQTLGFGLNNALKNGDVKGAAEAIALQKEILDPNILDKIVKMLPLTGAVRHLKDFFKAAGVKLSIDERAFGNMKTQIETGETDAEMWKRNREEQTQEEKERVDYYNEQRKLQVGWEQEANEAARAAQRTEDKKAREEEAKFWREEREKQRKQEELEREKIAEFWFEYRKRIMELRTANSPSQLNFGLL